jgi:nucleoid DNA-binding protein
VRVTAASITAGLGGCDGRAGLSRRQAREALTALEEVVLAEVGKAEKVKIGNVVQLTVRLKRAIKARKGRNPATGAEMTIGSKPASVDVRARRWHERRQHCLASQAKALPCVQAKRRLADAGLSLLAIDGHGPGRPSRMVRSSQLS